MGNLGGGELIGRQGDRQLQELDLVAHTIHIGQGRLCCQERRDGPGKGYGRPDLFSLFSMARVPFQV